ncbi:MAG: 30S ribosomal protein S18 [Nitrospirae bacterium]|nr:30S ribosomal protein S18 [Nitrospirota bacterium]
MQQRRFQRKKFCRFCADKTPFIDYKDVRAIKSYMTERGKILSRKITGACSEHQRELTQAIKRARCIALIPYMDR